MAHSFIGSFDFMINQGSFFTHAMLPSELTRPRGYTALPNDKWFSTFLAHPFTISFQL
jgi:hypothetical protein